MQEQPRERTGRPLNEEEEKETLVCSTMAVMLSVKEETRIESAGDDEGGDIKKQFGIEATIHDGDSLNSSSRNEKESHFNKQVSTKIATDTSSMESSPRPSSSNVKGTLTLSQENKLESTKAEMGEACKENERLKTSLARIVKDYQSLQIQFINMVQQEQAKTPVEAPPIRPDVEEPELISLSLGTSASGQKRGEKISTSKSKENDETEKGLALLLDCKYEGSNGNPSEPSSNLSPENRFEEPKEQEAGEPWPPSKILKNLRNGNDEVSQQTHVKKARVSVRARCDAPTMNDGCQWRKYGQKISKGNPCPRAYYRCTVAPACPVRKQVQRCAEDMSILITTYEGNHNHPLPISATAIASTTSAAACMLMSGSSTSRSATGSPASSSTTAVTIAALNANTDGLNFGLSDNSIVRQLYLSNPTITSSPYNPTITLDLTATPSSTTQPSQYNRFSSKFNSYQRHSSSFNFSTLESNAIPASWSNGYLSYGTQPYNMSHTESLSLQRQSQDPFYQSYLQKVINPASAAPTQNSLTDSIAKLITSDSSFQSVLSAAITSYVGAHGTQGAVESLSQNLKLGEQFNSDASYAVASTSNGCATNYLTTSTSSSSNPKQGNLLYLQPPLTFLSSKSAFASSVDNRENIS